MRGGAMAKARFDFWRTRPQEVLAGATRTGGGWTEPGQRLFSAPIRRLPQEMQDVHLKEVNGEETELFQILNTTDILYFILFFTVTNNCACQPYKPWTSTWVSSQSLLMILIKVQKRTLTSKTDFDQNQNQRKSLPFPLNSQTGFIFWNMVRSQAA